MGEKECRVVGIAEYRTASNPGTLTAYGLGSCVGVTLYDRQKKIGGLAHIMLPTSRLFSKRPLLGKYADTAIEAVLKELGEKGADLNALEAKITGGANMFEGIKIEAVPIGLRNVAAARGKLREKGVNIVSEDVGGIHGRTIMFTLQDGRLEVRKLNQPSFYI
jgi:chemotaxis protein CheD